MVHRPSSQFPASDIARAILGVILPRAAAEGSAEGAPGTDAPANAPSGAKAGGTSTFVRGNDTPWSDAARIFFQVKTPPPAGGVSTFNAPGNVAQVSGPPPQIVPPPPPPPPVHAPKIGSVKVTTEPAEHLRGPTPWAWNQWLPMNGGKDSKEYKHWSAMNSAAQGVASKERALTTAQANEANAKTTRDGLLAARDAAKADPAKLPEAEKKLREGEKAYAAAQAGTKTAQTALDRAKLVEDKASKDFKTFLKSSLPTIERNDPQLRQIAQTAVAADKALTAEKAKKPNARTVAKLETDLAALERKQTRAPTTERATLIADKQRELAAEKAKAPDPARVTELETTIKDAKAARTARKAALATEVENYQPIQAFDRQKYTVEIGGQTIKFDDHSQSYATQKANGLSGRGADGGQAGVERAVDASSLGADDKLIMKQISQHEGRFSSTESADIGGVTWGMLQWTTGIEGNGSLVSVMDTIKSKHPATFKAVFQDYGVDTRNGELTVTRPDGRVLTGAAAVDAVRSEPALSAVFAAAGTNTTVQSVQIELGKSQKIDREGLDRTAKVSAGGKDYTFSARQIFTSEWGAALVANAGVHGGPGAVSERLNEGLAAFFAANPKLDPTKPATWAGQAEAFVASYMIAGDSDRAKSFADAGLSKTPGTYQR